MKHKMATTLKYPAALTISWDCSVVLSIPSLTTLPSKIFAYKVGSEDSSLNMPNMFNLNTEPGFK